MSQRLRLARVFCTPDHGRALGWIIVAGLTLIPAVRAAQVDFPAPLLDGAGFGAPITVLPNGNFVVVDPESPSSAPGSPTEAIGAVYLYSPSGALLNTLTGDQAYDRVGEGGVVVVGSSNFVVVSPYWHNGSGSGVGAVTWVNGSTGLSGVVSASNSLVGTATDDRVGIGGVTALRNGNYVVSSFHWSNGAARYAGAVTWGDGSSGVRGPVSASNSLVGTTVGDNVGYGGVTALGNGNYVVASPAWGNGVPNGHSGAATWGNGDSGIRGPVSASNSLVGNSSADEVGFAITALSNGHYVVSSPGWNSVGAATWGNGGSGITGPVTPGNSLVGTTIDDGVGGFGVTALSNGNYVVASPMWGNGVLNGRMGAATWGNGSTGSSGPVSAGNSLVGTTVGDNVGSGVTALSNGNYVVSSSGWKNGVTDGRFGAATWGNGSSGVSGPVSASNSLVGTTINDRVGSGVTALSNGNYVVGSSYWNKRRVGQRFRCSDLGQWQQRHQRAGNSQQLSDRHHDR